VAADVRVNGQPLRTLAFTNPAVFDNVLLTCEAAVGLEILKSGAVSAAAVGKLAQCNLETASEACALQMLAAMMPGPALGRKLR
jgi:hypothetical protein